jgi:HSP20 family protein
MLMRFDPFRELDTLAQAMANASTAARGSAMPMDAYRDSDRLLVHIDLPGVDPDSIDLTVDKNVLTVTAERNWTPSEGQDVLVSERRQGRFSRQLFLGESLDSDRIEASYDRGVLTLVIPVAEQAKPRRVQIRASESGQPIETTGKESGKGSTGESATVRETKNEMAGSAS